MDFPSYFFPQVKVRMKEKIVAFVVVGLPVFLKFYKK